MKPGQVVATNEVDVDEPALVAEVAAVPLPDSPAIDGAPPAPEVGAGAADQAPPPSWAPITPPIIEAVDLFVCPAWNLTDQEKAKLADALAPVLDRLFPGGVSDERWAPYFRLLLIAGGIAAMRYDRKTGQLRPLREKPKTDEPAPARTADDDPGVGGGYSTAAH